jgi:dynein heavy chain
MKKQHQQMARWVKNMMVPVFREVRVTLESRGQLHSIWLGGLVNLQALFTALRQEKAVISNCLLDEVGSVVNLHM